MSVVSESGMVIERRSSGPCRTSRSPLAVYAESECAGETVDRRSRYDWIRIVPNSSTLSLCYFTVYDFARRHVHFLMLSGYSAYLLAIVDLVANALASRCLLCSTSMIHIEFSDNK